MPGLVWFLLQCLYISISEVQTSQIDYFHVSNMIVLANAYFACYGSSQDVIQKCRV